MKRVLSILLCLCLFVQVMGVAGVLAEEATYSVSVGTISGNGSLSFSLGTGAPSASLVSVAEGEIVTVRAVPSEGYLLVPGSLTYVTASGKAARILNKTYLPDGQTAFGEGDGYTYQFAMPAEAVTVQASFAATDEQSFRFDTIGCSVHMSGDVYDGIRFLTRVSFDVLDTDADALTVTHEGNAYTVTKIGMLLKRAGNQTELTLENSAVGTGGADTVWNAVAYDAETSPHLKVVDYTGSYLDVQAVMMKNVATTESVFRARQFSACGYVELADADGGKQIVYSNTTLTRSIKDITTQSLNPDFGDIELGGDTAYDTEHFRLGNGLANTYWKLNNKKELTVAFLGGSVTYGDLCANPEENAFRRLVVDWLGEQFPEATIMQVNASLSGACSAYGAYAVDEKVIDLGADLVFVEYAINDYYSRGNYDASQAAINYETIVRKLRRADPTCDMVALYLTNKSRNFVAFSAAQEEIAKHYGITSMNIGEQLRAECGMLEEADEWNTYFADSIHANATGHGVYGGAITDCLQNAFTAAQKSGAAQVTDHAMPKVKNSGLLMDTAYVDATELTVPTGWTLTNGGRLKNTVANAEFTYTFTGTDIGLHLAAASGITFDYVIDGGDAHTLTVPADNYLPLPIATGLVSKEHTLTLKVPVANAMKILAILVGNVEAESESGPVTKYDTDYFRLGNGLTNTYLKLKNRGELKVAFMGGSVTYGTSCDEPETNAYRSLVMAWLKEQFPHAQITQVNAALPSACSAYGAYAVDEKVIDQGADLVFVEYAVNDQYANSYYDLAHAKINYETVLRKLRTADPTGDIVALYVTNKSENFTEFSVAQEEIARHYGIPSVNIGQQLRVLCGMTDDVDEWSTYFADSVHANATGHGVYGEILTECLGKAFAAAQESGAATIVNKTLPTAMNNGLLMDTSYVDATELTAPTGWTLTGSGRLKNTVENAEFTYTFTGTGVALHLAAASGITFDYAVDGGEMQTVSISAANTYHLPLPVVEGLSSEEHTVTFKVPVANSMKILAILVSH